MNDPYYDFKNQVLFNKLNLLSQQELDQAEADKSKIIADLDNALNILSGRMWDAYNAEQQARYLAKDLARIWQIHCFREGNTRTTITFICQFADEHNIHLNRELFEKHSTYVRTALVAYCANLGESGNYAKPEYLENLLVDAII